jgi:arginine repressor
LSKEEIVEFYEKLMKILSTKKILTYFDIKNLLEEAGYEITEKFQIEKLDISCDKI